MKVIYLFLYISLIIYFSSCNKNSKDFFILDGTLIGARDSEVIKISYMSLKDEEWYKTLDSAYVKNGHFSFKGTIKGLTAGQLYLSNNSSVRIYMEPVKMKLLIDESIPYSYQLLGTETERENLDLRELLHEFEKKRFQKIMSIFSLTKQIEHIKDKEVVDSISDLLRKEVSDYRYYSEKNDSIRSNFVRTHPDYKISPDLLFVLAVNASENIDTLKKLYHKLPTEVKSSLIGSLALKEIKRKSYNSVMSMASDFVRIGALGDSIRLSDYRNKNCVLLDFWASWCSPCLKAIPEVKSLYNNYKHKGLAVIGVSLDEDRADWLGAIKKNGLSEWPQVMGKMDGDQHNYFSKNDLAELYNVQSIPLYILLDKQGRIVARLEHLNEIEIANLIKNHLDF